MKKTILFLLYLLFSLLVPSCAAPITYDQLSEEAARTGDTTEIEKFEERADKANIFFEQKYLCMESKDYFWLCLHGKASHVSMRTDISVEGRIRAWRKERFASCGCAKRGSLRNLF